MNPQGRLFWWNSLALGTRTLLRVIILNWIFLVILLFIITLLRFRSVVKCLRVTELVLSLSFLTAWNALAQKKSLSLCSVLAQRYRFYAPIQFFPLAKSHRGRRPILLSTAEYAVFFLFTSIDFVSLIATFLLLASTIQ